MAAKFDTHSETPRPRKRIRKFRGISRGAGEKQQVAPSGHDQPEQLIRWVESDLSGLGHGVQFLHDAPRDKKPVAFLEEYNWMHQPGSPATVRVVSTRPTSIAPDHWAEIIASTCEAVRVFLSDQGNFRPTFRHGLVHVWFNC